jgi:hypothetical protein
MGHQVKDRGSKTAAESRSTLGIILAGVVSRKDLVNVEGAEPGESR